MALDEGMWSASYSGSFTLGKESLIPTGYEAGWAPEPARMLQRKQKSFVPTGNLTLTIHPVVTPTPFYLGIHTKIQITLVYQ
jgi:hypothetical protein